MVDSETIETKISDKKEEFEDKVDEGKETFEEKANDAKDTFEDKKEKGKNIADNVISDLYKTIDEVKDNIRNIQKSADERYANYKKSTVQTLDVDYVETKDTYHIKVAVPGVEKEDILIEAGDNDITIETTFKPFFEEFTEDEDAELITSSIKSGRCVKTIRFGTSLDLENITAKF